MATTPYFVWSTQVSSSAAAPTADVADFSFGGAPENQAAATATVASAALGSPEFSASTVARPRLRRQSLSTGTGKQQQQQQQQVVAGGGGGGAAPRKPPQRGLGVAELERLRCGGDPLRDLSVAAGAAMGDAARVHGNSVLLHHHLPPPAFDATTAGSRYYSPLLIQPHPATLAAPPAPVCYVHSHSVGGQTVAAPEQSFMDPWGRMGGFAPAGSAGHIHQNLLPTPAPAPEHPSSQSTVWRPASSSASCLHTGHRCDLCSKTTRTLTERGSRVPAAAAATTNMPDYSIYDLAAAMAAARKDTAEGIQLGRDQGKKEVREIEFFPTSTNNHAGRGPEESEFASTHFSSATSSSPSGAGGCTAPPLDLSLKL